MARMFVLPTASRPLGLLYRANKAQVDFDSPTGAALGFNVDVDRTILLVGVVCPGFGTG
jgi:hypothetical protein